VARRPWTGCATVLPITRSERRSGSYRGVRHPRACRCLDVDAAHASQNGDIANESTNAADITDQFVDTEAQLASAQQLEKRLLELATAKNGTLDQILTVERELARVRGEIESFQGHLKQWGDQVSLSTLMVSIAQKTAVVAITPVPNKTLGSKTSESFHSSIDALRDVASCMLINGVALLPWLLFLVPASLGLRRLARRRHRIPVAVATIAPLSH